MPHPRHRPRHAPRPHRPRRRPLHLTSSGVGPAECRPCRGGVRPQRRCRSGTGYGVPGVTISLIWVRAVIANATGGRTTSGQHPAGKFSQAATGTTACCATAHTSTLGTRGLVPAGMTRISTSPPDACGLVPVISRTVNSSDGSPHTTACSHRLLLSSGCAAIAAMSVSDPSPSPGLAAVPSRPVMSSLSSDRPPSAVQCPMNAHLCVRVKARTAADRLDRTRRARRSSSRPWAADQPGPERLPRARWTRTPATAWTTATPGTTRHVGQEAGDERRAQPG